MAGEVVVHAKYGRGVVGASRNKGFELLVTFEQGPLLRWVRCDELELSSEPPVVKMRPAREGLPSDEGFRSRRVIEALRLGIVPDDCVDDLTVGRGSETGRLDSWMDGPAGEPMLLVGEYGTGKSHLLQHIYGRALDKGFAVARVGMDPQEVPFHKPKRIYERLVSSLQYRRAGGGPPLHFRDLLRQVFAKRGLLDHWCFAYLARSLDDEELWNWIEGRVGTRAWDGLDPSRYWYLPSLYDYTTASNLYCNLLSSLGWAAVQILGLKGLLLLFDEAETVDASSYYAYQAENGRTFIRALIRTAQSDLELLGPPGATGLGCCGHGPRVPFLYQRPSGLKVVLAFASLDWNHYPYYTYGPTGTLQQRAKIQELDDCPKLPLAALAKEEFRQVFERICELYGRAYGFRGEATTVGGAFGEVSKRASGTRAFVKASVEALDLIRLNAGGWLAQGGS